MCYRERLLVPSILATIAVFASTQAAQVPNATLLPEGRAVEVLAAVTTATPSSLSPDERFRLEKKTPTNPAVDQTPTGQLHIQSDPPGLEVLIDGKSVGLSPVARSLPVGEHTYRIIPPPGRATTERTVQIKTGVASMINIRY